MILQRIGHVTGTAMLAALMVFGTAGAAAATFSRQSTGSLSVGTFSLQPPTQLKMTSCQRSNGTWHPIVSFTPSTSIGGVPDHPATTPPQVFRYVTSLTVNGVVVPGGSSTLAASATKWTGPNQAQGNDVLTIVTTYGSWTSVAATVAFQC